MSTANGQGIDVSHYQGSINWATVAGNGVTYAMIKASEGNSYKDPMFAANWTGCKNNNIDCGAYHFFLPTDSFLQQADLLIGQLRSVEFNADTDLPPAIDCEEMEGVSASTYIYALKEMMAVLQKQLHCTPMIYVSPAFWQGLGNPDFTEYPLWVANYTSASSPDVPDPWKTYSLWQYSESGQVDGVPGQVDLDRSNAAVSTQRVHAPTLNWF